MTPKRFFYQVRLLALLAASACGSVGPLPAAPTAAATPSQAAEESSPALPLDPRITSGTLDNGLTYYLQQHRAKDRRAVLALVVKAGSV